MSSTPERDMAGQAEDATQPVVVVVGLGPAGDEFLTTAARLALNAAEHLYLRTARHRGAESLSAAGARSLDSHYEGADRFEDAYRAIVEELVAAAHDLGRVTYAVPGSPLVLERSVELLRADDRVRVELVTGLSFLDLAWDRLGLDPVAEGVRLIDGEEFGLRGAGEYGPFLVGQCWSRDVLSGIKLAIDEPPEGPVTILHHLGHDDEQVLVVALEDLDRALEPDHLTCVYLPRLPGAVGPGLARLDEVLRVLRVHCPWDAEQTHHSLVRHLLEETYEVIEAIEELGPSAASGGHTDAGLDAGAGAHLEEELGDLLTQILFHARLAAEEGLFDLSDVARTVTDKLVHRHPHVFRDGGIPVPGGDAGALRSANGTPVPAPPVGARGVEQRWEHLKQAEKGRTSLLEGIPASLPALMLAGKLERKARSVDLGWAMTGRSVDELDVLLDELVGGSTARAGELLFALARLAAHLGEDPEELARRGATAFRRRFDAAERAVERAGPGSFLTAAPADRLAAYEAATPDET